MAMAGILCKILRAGETGPSAPYVDDGSGYAKRIRIVGVRDDGWTLLAKHLVLGFGHM